MVGFFLAGSIGASEKLNFTRAPRIFALILVLKIAELLAEKFLIMS